MPLYTLHRVRSRYWHFRGAIEEGAEPPDEWLKHPDKPIKGQLALGVGLERLWQLSKEREAAGELVRAAEASYGVSMALIRHFADSVHESGISFADSIFRTQELLERADDKGESCIQQISNEGTMALTRTFSFFTDPSRIPSFINLIYPSKRHSVSSWRC